MTKRAWPAWADPRDILDLLRLSVPIAVSRSSFMLMFLTDTIVLGRNAPEQLPYVLNSHFPVGVLLGLSLGLLLGVSILTAEMAGRGEQENTGRVFRRGLLTASVLGMVCVIPMYFGAFALFASLGFEGAILQGTAGVTRILSLAILFQLFNNVITYYLEALRKPLLVAVAMYIGVVVNLFLDLAFVSGEWGFPQLGANGVAMATTGTNFVLMITLFVFVAIFTPGFKRSDASDDDEGKRQIRVGVGMAVSNIAEFGAFNFTHIIATWVGLAAASVYGMTFQTIGFVFMAFLGLGTATSVRVAERLGRGETQAVRNASRLGLLTCVLVGILTAILIVTFPEAIAAVFVQDDAVVAGVQLRPLLTQVVIYAAAVVLFDGIQNVAAMASRARGLVWQPALVHVGSYLGLMLPLAYVFSIHFERGVFGMLEGVIIASVVAGVSQVLILEFVAPAETKKRAET
ncbi:MATE family efflux transporter [Ponticaulis sp.]|uniref:MATE family efflux transporter n=1 Tax=Ponticaulis sp. TaxID=2020902 RepID=UPI000B65D25B|nr:MATE family efflux transporter [Ponticaulis sp.]MAI92124.1 multidrug transporter [Ponticaulis sp.]OUX96296.1 MAG: hypothetical protein CBB65_17000 [Hyphomonadaceae bacterium TMED5]|tara:strand:+ start:95463 stop:96839 length:1377 start_codon:yes stop_codon:yes gene_type:complete